MFGIDVRDQSFSSDMCLELVDSKEAVDMTRGPAWLKTDSTRPAKFSRGSPSEESSTETFNSVRLFRDKLTSELSWSRRFDIGSLNLHDY